MANLKKLVKRAKQAIADCESATKAARDFLSAQQSGGGSALPSCLSSSMSGENIDAAPSVSADADPSDMEGASPFST